MDKKLYWDSSYEIVQCLMDLYGEIDVESVGLDQLYMWVINLSDFADDPELVNDEILKGILREWYEEVTAR